MPRPAQTEPLPDWHGVGSPLLTWDDLDAVRGVLAEVAPSWSAELNQAAIDESTIVILPEGADDMNGPAFVLHRTYGRVHLDQSRCDEYRKLGVFGSVDDALAALRARLEPLVTGCSHGADFSDC